MTPSERLDALVALACEAWDRVHGGSPGTVSEVSAREEYEGAVRERLAQGVQAWTLDASLESEDARHAGRVFGLSEAAILARAKGHEIRAAAAGRELTGIGIRLLSSAETLDTWADRCAERAKVRL